MEHGISVVAFGRQGGECRILKDDFAESGLEHGGQGVEQAEARRNLGFSQVPYDGKRADQSFRAVDYTLGAVE